MHRKTASQLKPFSFLKAPRILYTYLVDNKEKKHRKLIDKIQYKIHKIVKDYSSIRAESKHIMKSFQLK